MNTSRGKAAALLICCSPLLVVADDGNHSKPAPPGVVVTSDPVVPYLTPALRDLPPATPWRPGDPVREVPRLRTHPITEVPGVVGGRDPLLDLQLEAPSATEAAFLTPDLNFAGSGYTGVNPPDTVGDVGPDHYVQMINGGGTTVQVFDKNGVTITGPISLTSLGGCATGSGDPIVLYDQMADRWLLSEFGAGNQLCIFVSQTPDPTGAFFSYGFPSANSFPDYPKYAVWPDAYYLGTNESSPTVYALDRIQMLAGNPATSQAFVAPSLSGFGFQMLTPADLDGATPPPAGSPGLFLRHRDTEAHGPAGFPDEDFIEIFEFHVDWAVPGSSTLSGPFSISVAEFDSDLCGLFSFSAIAMPGVPKCSGGSLDPLREVTMWRNQYRNFGDHETVLGNLATDVTGADDAGVRWFELRKTGAGPWILHQEGTYAPDGDSRWMGSAAMDGAGNIAVGYNISSSSTFPGLRYAGRLQSDPLGTLPQGEGVIVNGSASNASNRYGDYSAMTVDPADDCTFWFTGQFNDASQWSTQIATMKFDACGTPDFTLAVTPASLTICIGEDAQYDVSVGSVSGYTDDVTLSASGNPGSAGFSTNPVTPPGASTLTITGVGDGIYSFDVEGASTTGTKGAPIGLVVEAAAPGAVSLLAPADGALDVDTSPTYSWSAVAGASGYLIEVASDPGFSNIVDQGSVTASSYESAVSLSPTTTYFWRVFPFNTCGTGAASSVFSFTTVNVICRFPGVAIPDNDAAGVGDTAVIATSGTLTGLDVVIDATHTFVGDLIFTLTHDGGATVDLIDRPGVPASTYGCSGDNVSVTMDDDGTEPVEDFCSDAPALFGSLIPNNPLAAFSGEDLSGNWTMTVSDNAGFDTGTFDSWCLVPSVEILLPEEIFADGFEAGDLSAWSSTVP